MAIWIKLMKCVELQNIYNFMSMLIKLGHVDVIEYMDENMTMKINLIILHKFITWMKLIHHV
jgi:hypothetical protein